MNLHNELISNERIEISKELEQSKDQLRRKGDISEALAAKDNEILASKTMLDRLTNEMQSYMDSQQEQSK